MAKKTQAERVKQLFERIHAEDRRYKAWEEEYEVRRGPKYYAGKQWRGKTENEAKDLYVTNLVFPTIETQLPSLLFANPKVRVEPRPTHIDDLGSQAATRAALIESTLQTLIDDPKLHFSQQTLLSLRDGQFRFSVVEVGYTADWIDNPNADKPVLKEKSNPDEPDSPMLDRSGQPVLQPGRLPENERLYLKRIPPQNFRAGGGKNILLENDWSGYREWHFVEDVKRNPKYRNTSNLKATGREADTPEHSSDPDAERHADMVCLWKIWDHRTKTRCVLAEGHDKYLLEDEPWTVLPFGLLKFYELADEFYPLPPVYNWLSPQDEINETREMQKTHRRRFTRRYTMKSGNMKPDELEKIQTGGDGVVAESNVDDPLRAVPDAPLDRSNTVEELALAKEDFMQIAGVGQNARGAAEEDTTATEANIVNQRLQIRETRQRVQVADWLADICRIMLLTIREKMQLEFLVKVQTDPFAEDQKAVIDTVQGWAAITAEQLGDLDVDVKVDIASLSPVSEGQQLMQWNQVLALLGNPGMLMLLMMPNPANPEEPSPLLRKTLGFYGIKSEQEIREIMRVGQSVLVMTSQMAQQAPPQKGPGTPQGRQPGQPSGIPAQAPMGVQ